MKKLIILLVGIILLCGCENKEEENTIKKISCSEMKELVDSEDALLIDVRANSEFETYHLDYAINIEYTQISKIIEDVEKDKDRKIIVYCQSGKRSDIAAQSLKELGYKNIYDLGSINNCEN